MRGAVGGLEEENKGHEMGPLVLPAHIDCSGFADGGGVVDEAGGEEVGDCASGFVGFHGEYRWVCEGGVEYRELCEWLWVDF